MSPGGADGAGGSTVQCLAGGSCECEPGHYGRIQCDSGSAECDCSQCEPYEATSKQTPDFEACGGEPFGDWRLTNIDIRGLPLVVTVESGGIIPTRETYECDAELGLVWSGRGLVSLKEGGAAWVSTPPYSSVMRFPGSRCNIVACENITGCKLSNGCAMCECSTAEYGVRGGSYEPDGTWSRDGTLLYLPGPTGSGEYCVTEDQLKINFGAEGVYTFEKVNLVGRPQECEARKVDACESAGCHIGECVGEEKCADASSASTCSTLSGCSWDDTVCRGTAPESCGTSDYGQVPGCEIVTESAHCEGEAPKCQDLDEFTCDEVPGCKLGLCTEEAEYDCSDFTPPDCETIAGCTDGITRCDGYTTCGDQINSDGCWALDCYWDNSLCGGESTSCEGLDLDACRATAYCTVVAD